MLVEKAVLKNLWCIRLNPGDDVFLSLSEAVKKHGINNALIISAAGSSANYHFHVVASPQFPPENIFVKGDKASDVLTLSGVIINGRVHAHISHGDKDNAYGGHLEAGVKVLTFMSIALAEVDLDLDNWDAVGKIEEYRKN